MSAFPCALLLDLPNWLGDVVLALPALHKLVQANGRGKTTVLLPPPYAPLLAPWGVEVVARPPGAGFRWSRRVLAGNFHVAMTFRHSTRAKLLLAGAQATLALASEGRGAKLFGLTCFALDRHRHQIHDFDRALEHLGVEGVNGAAPLLRPEGRRPGELVVLLPGARSQPAKRYPPEGFVAVAQALKSAGFPVGVLVGSEDTPLGVHIATEGGVELLSPGLPLPQVVEVFRMAALAVGNDSGLTHLASACGVRVVALFGPTSPRRTAPWGSRVLQAESFQHRGWEGLPPQRIVEAALEELSLSHAKLPFASRLGEGTVVGVAPGREGAYNKFGGGPLAQLAEQGTLNP